MLSYSLVLKPLDRLPVLWNMGKWPPPLLDAINGVLNSEAVQEKITDAFCSWPIGAL